MARINSTARFPQGYTFIGYEPPDRRRQVYSPHPVAGDGIVVLLGRVRSGPSVVEGQDPVTRAIVDSCALLHARPDLHRVHLNPVTQDRSRVAAYVDRTFPADEGSGLVRPQDLVNRREGNGEVAESQQLTLNPSGPSLRSRLSSRMQPCCSCKTRLLGDDSGLRDSGVSPSMP